MKEKNHCGKCGKIFPRSEMLFTKDCHGVPFRLVCLECYDRIMRNGRGYDGAYYTELDEQIEPDY